MIYYILLAGSSINSVQNSTAGAGAKPQGAIRGLSGASAANSDSLIGKKVWTRWPDDNNFYEAVITDYNSVEVNTFLLMRPHCKHTSD